jgi:hypothetical protein
MAEKTKMGRPGKIQDLDKLKSLMRLNPTLADTAAFFECGERTVEDTIRNNFDLTFREFRQQNMVHTRLSLIRKAVSKAESGDNVMLIFCLKNLCGWADKQETKLDGSGAVFTLAYSKEALKRAADASDVRPDDNQAPSEGDK